MDKMNFKQINSIESKDRVTSSYQIEGFELTKVRTLVNALCQGLDGIYQITVSYPTGHDLRQPPKQYESYEDYIKEENLLDLSDVEVISVRGLKGKEYVTASINLVAGAIIIGATISKNQVDEYCHDVETKISKLR